MPTLPTCVLRWLAPANRVLWKRNFVEQRNLVGQNQPSVVRFEKFFAGISIGDLNAS